MKFPGVVAVLCVVPSGLVLQIGITSCTFPPWTEMSTKNEYEVLIKALWLTSPSGTSKRLVHAEIALSLVAFGGFVT